MAKWKYKVWIEPQRPQDEEDAKRKCELVNKMLRRLGVEFDAFWYHPKYAKYCVNLGPGGAGFLVCEDWGHWFFLEPLAGEITQTVSAEAEQGNAQQA